MLKSLGSVKRRNELIEGFHRANITVSLDAVCAVAYAPGREKLSAFSYLYLDDFCDMLLGAQMKIVLTTGRLRMS